MPIAHLSFRIAVFFVLLAAWADGRAALIRVCDGVACDYPTIQEAIDAASPDDTILVNKLIHTEAGIEVTKNLTIAGIGQHATVVQASENAPPDQTEAEQPPAPPGGASGRVFSIPSGVEARIREMTIRHGFATLGEGGGGGILNLGSLILEMATVELNGSVSSCGGGILNRKGMLTAEATQVQNNTAGGVGGGLCNLGGTVELTNETTVRSNRSLSNGAGIYHQNGRLSVTASTFEGNRIINRTERPSAGAGLFAFGGRVLLDQATVLENVGQGIVEGGGIATERASVDILLSSITGNRAGEYGGLSVRGGQILVVDSTIDLNFGSSFGGGLNLRNGARATIRGSTFFANRATSGSFQIGNNGRRLDVSNSTITGQVPFPGSGISNAPGSDLEVINSTIADHTDIGILNQGTARISNSIVARNLLQDCRGKPLQAIGPNLAGDRSCQSFTILEGFSNLQPLAANGGPTKTQALGDASEAIDAGDDGICNASPISAEDQRHVVRPKGEHCDLGAYERDQLIENVAVNLLLGGAGAGIVTWVRGVCEWDPESQQQKGECNGDVEPGAITVAITPLPGSELGETGDCDDLIPDDDGVSFLCAKDLTSLIAWTPTIEFKPATFGLSVRSHDQSTGFARVTGVAPPGSSVELLECDIHPVGQTNPLLCFWFIKRGAILELSADAGENSVLSEWIGCDDGGWIDPQNHQSGTCTVTMTTSRQVTLKVDQVAPEASQPEVIAVTGDETEPGSGQHIESFGDPAKTAGDDVFVPAVTFFDTEAFEQSLIRFPPDSERTVEASTGDPSPFDPTAQIDVFERLFPGPGARGVTVLMADGAARRVSGHIDPLTFAELRSVVGESQTFDSLESIAKLRPASVLSSARIHSRIQPQAVIGTVVEIRQHSAEGDHLVIEVVFDDGRESLLSADVAADPVNLGVLFSSGDLVNGTNVFERFALGTVPGIGMNPSGDGAVVAEVTDPGTGLTEDAIVTFDTGASGAAQLMRVGDLTAVPGVIVSRLTNVAIDGDGVIAVLGRVAGAGITSSNDEAVWVCVSALCSIAVQEGMEPDGMPGVRLRFPGSPVVHGGMLLMRTVLEGTGIDSTNNNGILLVDLATGAIRLAAQKGDAFAGSTIADFTSKAFSNETPLVVVRLSSFARALARIDPEGLVPLIAPGDEFTLTDGTVGVVAGVIDIPETGGEDGRSSAVDGGGYAVVVLFTDGREGLVICTATCLEGGG